MAMRISSNPFRRVFSGPYLLLTKWSWGTFLLTMWISRAAARSPALTTKTLPLWRASSNRLKKVAESMIPAAISEVINFFVDTFEEEGGKGSQGGG